MSAIEDLINTISQVGSGIDTALTHIETADSQGSQTMNAFQLAGAEDKIMQLQGVIDKLNEVRKSLIAAKSGTDEAQQLAVGVKGLAGDGTERLPSQGVGDEPGYPGGPYRLSESDLLHIMYGDLNKPESAGHVHGRGGPGKTEFPPGWQRSEISAAVRHVAKNPIRVTQIPRQKFKVTGSYRGVTMTAVVTADSSIEAAWPKHGPGVRRNPRAKGK